jgi:hypothetical protein
VEIDEGGERECLGENCLLCSLRSESGRGGEN